MWLNQGSTMAQKYDSVVDFGAFQRLRDNFQDEFARGLNQAAEQMREHDVGERLGEAGSVFGRSLNVLFDSVADGLETAGRFSRDADRNDIDNNNGEQSEHRDDTSDFKNTEFELRPAKRSKSRPTGFSQSSASDTRASTHKPSHNSQNTATIAFETKLYRAENDDGYWLMFSLPGVDPDSVDLQLEGFTLVLTGIQPIVSDVNLNSSDVAATTNDTAAKKSSNGIFKQQSFKRTVSLPADADSATLTAECKNGLLTVSVHKISTGTSRRIQIKSD